MFFFSSRRRHTRWPRDWSSDVCSSDLATGGQQAQGCSKTGTVDLQNQVPQHRHFQFELMPAAQPPLVTQQAFKANKERHYGQHAVDTVMTTKSPPVDNNFRNIRNWRSGCWKTPINRGTTKAISNEISPKLMVSNTCG